MHKKAGHWPAFWILNDLFSETADMLIQTALVTSGLVCMNQSLAGSAVNDRNRCSIGLCRAVTIACLDGGYDFLYRGAHIGPLAGVPLTVYLRLPCALGCLC